MAHDATSVEETGRGASAVAALHDYRQFVYYGISVGFFLIVWEAMAIGIASGLLPRISPVVREMWAIAESGVFFSHLIDTLRRVAVGFLLAYGLSIPLGIGMGLDERVEYLAEIPVLIGISVPGLAVAILAIIWFGLAELTAYVSVFLLATPMIVFNFWQGTKSIDRDLIEMGAVFETGRLRTARHIILPSLLPHLLAAARFGLALSWKIVVIVELLGLTSGVGYMINNEFQLYSIVGVLAWTLNFTIVMVLIEFGLLKTLERRVTGWRESSQEGGIRA